MLLFDLSASIVGFWLLLFCMASERAHLGASLRVLLRRHVFPSLAWALVFGRPYWWIFTFWGHLGLWGGFLVLFFDLGTSFDRPLAASSFASPQSGHNVVASLRVLLWLHGSSSLAWALFPGRP